MEKTREWNRAYTRLVFPCVFCQDPILDYYKSNKIGQMKIV